MLPGTLLARREREVVDSLNNITPVNPALASRFKSLTYGDLVTEFRC